MELGGRFEGGTGCSNALHPLPEFCAASCAWAFLPRRPVGTAVLPEVSRVRCSSHRIALTRPRFTAVHINVSKSRRHGDGAQESGGQVVVGRTKKREKNFMTHFDAVG